MANNKFWRETGWLTLAALGVVGVGMIFALGVKYELCGDLFAPPQCEGPAHDAVFDGENLQ